MALVKPQFVLNQYGCMNVCNSEKDYVVNFVASNGDQFIKNNLSICRNDTNEEVYNKEINNFQANHIIPANTLKTNMEYRMKIRIGDAFKNWSEFSDVVILKCLSLPKVSIINIIDGKVGNQTFLFLAEYKQEQSEPLQSYKFYLYNESQDLIAASPEKLYAKDNSLTHEFAGLINNSKYFIEIKVTTQNYMEATSGKIPFTAQYIQPRLNTVLKAENIFEEGSIKLTAQICQIIGQVGNGTITYEDNEWINLKNGMVYWQENFHIANDFTLKLWCKNLTKDKEILILYGKQGKIVLWYDGNRIKCYKIINNVLSSNKLTPYYVHSQNLNISSENDEVFIFLQQINNFINLKAEKI